MEQVGSREMRRTCLFMVALLLQFLVARPAGAADLPRFLTDIDPQLVFPGADRIASSAGLQRR